MEANNSLASMKDKCEDHNEQISVLSDELGTLTDEFRQLSDRSKIVSHSLFIHTSPFHPCSSQNAHTILLIQVNLDMTDNCTTDFCI